MSGDFRKHGRELYFQRRVLAAVEKQKSGWAHRIVDVINSALFLWFLSAIFIASMSTLYAAYQQCLKEATEAAQKHDVVWAELNSRYRYIGKSILDAASPKDAISALKSIPSLSFSFKDATLFDLHSQIVRIRRLSDAPLDLDRWVLFEDDNSEHVTVPDRYRFADILAGTESIQSENLDMEKFKAYLLGVRKTDWLGYKTVYLHPICNVCSVVSRYLKGDYNTPILRIHEFRDSNYGPIEQMNH